MPTDRDELIQRYNLWRRRNRMDMSIDEKVLELYNKWKDEETKKNRGKKKQ